MKLVEMKCKNCGANLEVEEGKDIVECPYCNASYKIDDEVQHVEYDNMENSGYEFEKGRIKAQKEQFKNSENIMPRFIILGFGVVMFVVIFVISMINMNKITKNFDKTEEFVNDNFSNSKEEILEEKEKVLSDFEISSFNTKFEIRTGTNGKFMVSNLLDEVVTNNKTNDNKVTVRFNDIVTENPEEIIGIKKQLVDKVDYEVSLEYGENKLVKEVKIEQ